MSELTEIVRRLDDRDDHVGRLKSVAKVIDKMRNSRRVTRTRPTHQQEKDRGLRYP
jgi:hypothetical protein